MESTQAPPRKPWEIDAGLNGNIGPSSSMFSQPSSMPTAPSTFGPVPAQSSNFYSQGTNYYDGGGGGYGSGFYGAHNYGNRPLFGQNVPFLSGIEAGTNSVVEQIRRLVQAITSVAQFLDSTVYAGWSSVNAIRMVIDNLKQFQTMVISRWIFLLKYLVELIVGFFRRGSKNGQGKFASSTKAVVIASALVPAALSLLSVIRFRTSLTGRVIFDYQANEPDHLEAHTGDQIQILASEDDWVYAKNSSGNTGFIPKSFIAHN